MAKKEIKNYEEAYDELQQIMQDLQDDEISVDQLSVKVKRASELIKFCNQKLRSTESEIADIVKELDI